MIGLAIIIVLLVLLLPQALFIVPQQNVYIIERLGKFNRTVGAGLNIKIPFFETIAAKVDMRTRQEQFGIDAKTRDNVTVTMAIAAQYRVSAQPAANGQPSGVWRSYYMLANPTAQMRSYLIDALRSSVPQYTLDEVFDKKDAIASDVNQTVSGLMVAYGLRRGEHAHHLHRFAADVEQSMNRINSAQREKEAAQSLAEAERIKVVTEAAPVPRPWSRPVAASRPSARPSPTASRSRSRSSRAPACRRPRPTSCSSSPSGPT